MERTVLDDLAAIVSAMIGVVAAYLIFDLDDPSMLVAACAGAVIGLGLVTVIRGLRRSGQRRRSPDLTPRE